MKTFFKIFQVIILIMLSSIISENFNAQTNIEKAFPNLTFLRPVDIQHSGDNTNRIFIVSQAGKIEGIENNISTSSKFEFLDITNRVDFGGEKGLLGLAFHPNYNSNGYFYINYTASSPLRTIISRFSVSVNDGNKADELRNKYY